MKQILKMLSLNLQLFAEGGAEGGTDGADGGAVGVTASVATKQTGRNSNSLANVVYGKQPNEVSEEAIAQDDNEQKADRTESYKKFKDEYKDLYDAEVQNIIKSRIRNSKGVEERLNALNPVIEMLSKKYGVEDASPESILKALEDDNSFFEEEAAKKGLSVEQYKQISKMERENENLKRAMEEQRMHENASRQYKEWLDESERLKAMYPSFDLESELENEQFLSIVKLPGVDLKTAFEIIHKDEIIPAAMQIASQKTAERITNSVKANGLRPTENSNASSPGTVIKSDPSKFTKADIAEIEKRALRGEKIIF